MNVRAEIDDDIWMTDAFYIQMYDFMASADRWMVMMGETVEIVYEVVELATETVYADVNIEWNAWWYNESGNVTMEDGTLAESAGVFEYTIPSENIATWTYVYLTMWANGTDDDRSVEWSTNFALGWLGGDVGVDNYYYYPGDTVTVSVDAWVEDSYGNWGYMPDADVEVTVEFNGTEIADYGKVGMTDSQGTLEYEFDLMADAERGSYLVTATISKLDSEVVRMTSFQLYWSGYLDITTDLDTYLSGELVRLTFTVVWNDEDVNATPVHYTVWDSYSSALMGSGDAVTGTDAMFEIPDDFVGEMEIYAEANLDGMFLSAWEWVDVVFAEMALSPEADRYTPGDTITWLFEVMTVSANGTLSYTIEDDEGDQVDAGTMALVPSGALTYHVPATSESSWYMATLTFDAGDSWLLEETSTIYRVSAYDVSIWLNSDSKFVSGAFEPGTELSFGFEIVAYEDVEPRMYEVVFYIDNADSDYTMFASAGEGEFLYQIPDDAVDGWYGVCGGTVRRQRRLPRDMGLCPVRGPGGPVHLGQERRRDEPDRLHDPHTDRADDRDHDPRAVPEEQDERAAEDGEVRRGAGAPARAGQVAPGLDEQDERAKPLPKIPFLFHFFEARAGARSPCHFRSSAMPSLSDILGEKPTKVQALVTSARLCLMSPFLGGPNSGANSFPAAAIVVFARSSMLVEDPLPQLNTWPDTPSLTRTFLTNSATSIACTKSLVCRPSPSTSGGLPSFTRATNLVMTPEYGLEGSARFE